MQSDVWCLLTCIDDDGSSCTTGTSTWTGSKYLEYNPGSELNLFLLNNEQWINKKLKNRKRTKFEPKNEWKSNNEQQ